MTLEKNSNENDSTVIPEKFLDKEGNVNVNDLAKSYVALEKKLGAPKEGSPSDAKGYKINLKSPLLVMDEKINERLFALGLTNDQVQGVYDIAAEILIPQIQAMTEQLSADKELQELEEKLRYYKTDLEATIEALEDKTIHYTERVEYQRDLSEDRIQIANLEKQIKVLKMGKIIK